MFGIDLWQLLFLFPVATVHRHSVSLFKKKLDCLFFLSFFCRGDECISRGWLAGRWQLQQSSHWAAAVAKPALPVAYHCISIGHRYTPDDEHFYVYEGYGCHGPASSTAARRHELPVEYLQRTRHAARIVGRIRRHRQHAGQLHCGIAN